MSILSVLLSDACTAAGAGAPAQTADIEISAALDAARSAAHSGDPEAVLLALEPAMKDDLYRRLSPPTQHEVAELDGLAAMQTYRWSRAHQAFVRATDSPSANSEDWLRRWLAAIYTSDARDAYDCLVTLSHRDVPFLQTADDYQMAHLMQLVDQSSNARDARLLIGREMERENWGGPDQNWGEPDLAPEPSHIWLYYLEALLEEGDSAKAAEVANRITDPMVLVAMQADRRFDAIIAANPAAFDPAAAADRRLARAQRLAGQNPRSLGAKLAVSEALDILNRQSEALALTDDVAQAIARQTPEQQAFDDPAEGGAIVQKRAIELFDVGRVDEALGAMSADAQLSGPAGVHTLGQSLMKAGRAKEALKWLRGAPTSFFTLQEQMSAVYFIACADAEAGERADLRKQLDFLAANERWGPTSLDEALICAGQLDQAAAAIKRQLADPRERLATLAALQVYAEQPGRRAFTDRMNHGWATVRSMPDVQAAIAKVGRVRTYALLEMIPQY